MAHLMEPRISSANLAESCSQRGKVLANTPVPGLDDTGDAGARVASTPGQESLATDFSPRARVFFKMLQLCLLLVVLL
jgi:hypothetical protein